jgi:hypothetical protein
MADDYSILVSAIADVGYWRWWSEQLPELFQLEFGGVQFYIPPEDKSKPPSSLLALRFIRPSRVSFIRRNGDLDELPVDWPNQLKEEEIDPFGISHEKFALGDDALFNEIVSQTESEITYFTDSSGGRDVKLAFWSGAAGVRIEAVQLRLFLMSGEIELSTFASLNNDWWSYWQDYWKKRDTTEALPKDFACEVTIPCA